MDCNRKKTYIVLVILFTLISSNSVIALPNNDFKSTDIETFTYKQKIEIPFETSLPEAKYQPIDIRIDFENKCWGKDERVHSIRVGMDDKTSITELESQIYDIKFSNDGYIDSCNLVFLIPYEADGKEEYFVCYDSSDKGETDYEKHIEVFDSHYFYEPIPGQIIDVDYYGIREGEFYTFGIIQKGSLLGNPVSQGVIKTVRQARVIETYNLDQLCMFDMSMNLEEEPGYKGTAWETDIKKSILIDGNLMIRLRIEGKSPDGDILTNNIFTYYYSPTDVKRLLVDVYHEILDDINIDKPGIHDGTITGIISIKSRSDTIEDMNAGDILPDIHVYTEDNTIENFPFPPNPSTLKREIIISTEDDIDIGEHAWFSLSNPDTGIAHAIILDSNTGMTEENDGGQIKAWGKENVKLPGLEADTGNLYLSVNTYENNNLNTIFKKGLIINYQTEFITFYENGLEQIDKESDIFQKRAEIMPPLRENISGEEEGDTERFSLTTFVHNARSTPLGSLLCAVSGRKLSYIYAELFEPDDFHSSGSVNRLAMHSIDLDLEGKSIFEILRIVLGMFDFKNSSFVKKIVFPDLETGRYLVKIYRENPRFGEERRFIGYGITDVSEDTTLRIFCTSEGISEFKVLNQDESGVKNVKFSLSQDDVIISDGITDEKGSVILKAPNSIRDPYMLRILYDGFLIKEEEIRLGLINRLKIYRDELNVDLFNLRVKIVDKWGFEPYIDVNMKLTSNDMTEDYIIKPVKIDNSEYVFEDILGANYFLNLKHKSFQIEENVKIDNDKILDLVFPEEYLLTLNVLNKIGVNIDDGIVIASRNGKYISSDINKEGITSFTIPPGEYQLNIEVEDEPVAFQKVVVSGEKTLDIVTKIDAYLHSVILIIGLFALICIIVYMIWKRKITLGLKFIVIVLLFMGVFQPWWFLNGEEGSVTTNTITMLYPPNMITLTESSDALGGSVSALPQELIDILVVISTIIVVSIFLLLLNIFLGDRYKKTGKIIFITTIILILAAVSIFYYALSIVTEVGVGSFIGSGDVSTSIPGFSEGVMIKSNWGPGLGFYLGIISIIVLFANPIYKKFKK